ncbi:hypothetical protein D3C72_2330110 [compost metagenome]
MAPLSLAEDTFMPVFTRFCVIARSRLVLFRFCRATRAPALVLMLLAILVILTLYISDIVLMPGAFCSGGSPIERQARRPAFNS